jgi:hypothetical protein
MFESQIFWRRYCLRRILEAGYLGFPRGWRFWTYNLSDSHSSFASPPTCPSSSILPKLLSSCNLLPYCQTLSQFWPRILSHILPSAFLAQHHGAASPFVHRLSRLDDHTGHAYICELELSGPVYTISARKGLLRSEVAPPCRNALPRARRCRRYE